MADPNISDPNAVNDPNSWSAAMPRNDRVKVCQHIMLKLAAYYHNVPEAALKEKTRAFEAQAYGRAVSRRDYLEKIAKGSARLKTRLQSSLNAALQAAGTE